MTGDLPTAFVSALAIGALAALPLMLGAWLALRRSLPGRLVGLVAAFGAGALICAITFELVLDAVARGGPVALGFWLAAGAIAYFLGSELLERRVRSGAAASRGIAILMGAMLDGIPESFILGLSIATGTGLSVPFLLAVVISNFPEGMASAAELRGQPGFSDRRILVMWGIVIAVSALAAAVGATVSASGNAGAVAAAEAFAAGALLTMLIDDLVPEARERGGLGAGLVSVMGFAVAFVLHQIGR
ncbi:ZIP family zinc transporter [Burkholderiaceae bacterium FT117]|uniref:ZIP family metal transporter n=1 Tax=Zeimonas sediminis TaxID=2944268 RepID=UPI002342D20D|nr:ZIP family zinc transporter [Zeimonas sediminis]MCM5570819.1 ZIP family zinc transporter [Zeimonas sediminis]